MPEAGKVTAQIMEEVACIRKARPDLRLVAIADAAVDNWTFLEGLQPDEQVVDFFGDYIPSYTNTIYGVLLSVLILYSLLWVERYIIPIFFMHANI